MTTLPQTTTLRLPRPAGSPQLSIPGGHAPVGILPQSVGGAQMTGGDVWRVLRSNLWLIGLFVAVSAVSGYFLNYWLAKYHPKYTATGWVAINPPVQIDPLATTHGLDMMSLALEQKTHAQLLKNPSLFSEVLQDENSPIRDTSWIQQFKNTSLAKQDLTENLMVTPSTETNLIKVDMSFRDPTDCKKIIEAVVDQHIRDQERDNKDAQLKRSVTLTQMRDRYERRHSELADELNDKQMKLNISGTGTGAGRLNIKDAEMSDLMKSKMEAELQATSVQDAYNGLTSQISSGQDPAAVTEAVSRDPEVQKYRQYVNEVELRLLNVTPDFGEKSDQVLKLKSQKELFAKKLEKAESDVRSQSRATLMESARHQLESAKAAVARVDQQIALLDSEISDLNRQLVDYLTEKEELVGIDTKLKEVNDQIDQIARYTSQKDLTNLEWKSRPEATDIPTFPKLGLTMTVAIALGLGLSLGDRVPPRADGHDHPLAARHQPRRQHEPAGHGPARGRRPAVGRRPPAAGDLRGPALDDGRAASPGPHPPPARSPPGHDAQHPHHQPQPRRRQDRPSPATWRAAWPSTAGASSWSTPTSAGPELHRIFNLGNEQGFSDVLNGLDLFETAVQETQVPNLYVMPSGPKPTNATELLESQLLIDFIERALEEFDHVIFDSGPMLFVSETVAMAPRVDGVVTVVRARTNSRGVLSRCATGSARSRPNTSASSSTPSAPRAAATTAETSRPTTNTRTAGPRKGRLIREPQTIAASTHSRRRDCFMGKNPLLVQPAGCCSPRREPRHAENWVVCFSSRSGNAPMGNSSPPVVLC